MKRDDFDQANRRILATPSASRSDSFAEKGIWKGNGALQNNSKCLELPIFKALKTIKPTSVEPKGAFLAIGF